MIVLVPHCGFLSETSRMIAIARALAARGIQTSVASHGGPYAHLLDEAGIAWTALEPTMTEAEHRAFLDALLSIGVDDRPFYEDAFMRRAIRAEADHFREVGAKLAVIGFNLTTYFSTRVAGIPLAASHGGSFLPPVLERGLCPLPVNPSKPEMARLPKFVQRWLVHNAPYLLKGPTRHLNRIAEELGVPKLASFMAMMCADLTLVTEIPEVLGIPRDEMAAWRPRSRKLWPSTRMRYVGPLYAKLDRPVPEHVERFLGEPGKVVLVAPTSVSASFLRTLVPAVRAAGARVLVAATINDVGDLTADGVVVADVLPNHLVMPRVAAAVIMGGQGSVQTAMASGTPFVGMPYHGEQELNVALAERKGMAIRISPKLAGESDMTAAVRRLLEEPSFREGAARMRELYAGTDGAAGAADAIIDFVGAGRESPLHERSATAAPA